MPEIGLRIFAQTLPAPFRQEWPVRKELAGEAGSSGASPHVYRARFRLKSGKLSDLGGAIPDILGLRAIQPKAAVVKVMSVPNSRCVRVVVPDDHVPNRCARNAGSGSVPHSPDLILPVASIVSKI